MNRVLFFALYFFEGAPIGLIWWAIPTLMSSEGVDVADITSLTAAAALPWTFKFLLGPFVDRYFVSLRSFSFGVAFFQSLMLIGFLLLLFTPTTHPSLFWIVLGISTFSATQDVIIDAWAIGFVDQKNRGSVNGAMQAGMLSGRWLFGAGLLMVLAYLNWSVAISFLCILLACSIVCLIVYFRTTHSRLDFQSGTLSLKGLSFILSRKFILLAAIALLTGFAFESVGGVVGPFLIENGFKKEWVGGVMSVTLVFMLIGALYGGRLADRKGSKGVFFYSGLVLSGLIALLAAADFLGMGSWVLVVTVVLIYLLIGKFTASSYAYYMNHSHGTMEATKFTFLMAMTNLCESSSAYVTGQIASTQSYGLAFVVTASLSLVGLGLLRRYG